MKQDLIRQEVMDVQATRWLGNARLATPVSARVWTAASVCIAVLVIMWLFVGHYTQRRHVDGILVPRAGLLTVTARNASTITQVAVSEGMVVRAGDPMLTMSTERSSPSLGDTVANISQQLRDQKSRVAASQQNARLMAKQQVDDLHMQQQMLEKQIIQLDDQIAIEKKEATSQHDMLAKLTPLLSKGYVSNFTVQQQQTQENEAELQVKSLTRERYDAQKQLLSVKDSLTQMPLATQSKLDELRSQEAQIEESLQTNEADRATVLRAPKGGIVTSVLVKPGQAVAPGQSLVAIVPENSPLLAQLLVPSSAIGFVHPGTKVTLHYQAFPYQKFGVQHGVVETVSHSALTPSEVTVLLGDQAPSGLLYRVQVGLTSQEIQAYGKSEHLLPGMSVEANLLLDRRPIIEWIFEPLYGFARRQTDSQS